MNKKIYLSAVFAVLIIGVLLLLGLRQEDQKKDVLQSIKKAETISKQTPNLQKTTSIDSQSLSQQQHLSPQEEKQKQIESEKKVWNLYFATPITFYGRVIDEKEQPISEANVEASFTDHIMGGNTKRQLKTGTDGFFKISGNGLGIIIQVSKDGYYRLDQSHGSFVYVKEAGPMNVHADPNNPAIFVLRKKGKSEFLIKCDRDFKIPKNGEPVQVDITTGKTTNLGDQVIKVMAWTNDQGHDVNSNAPYDWRCKISVSNGGLIQRTGEFSFEAPESGYQSEDEINIPASLGSEWRSQLTKNYFVKFGNNYARVEFTMTAGGEHFFTLTSYLNPTPGSRNLEYDPAKTVPNP